MRRRPPLHRGESVSWFIMVKIAATVRPDGVMVGTQRDDDGTLLEESFTVGLIEIGITRTFTDGVLSDERYICRNRLVSRAKYEEVRLAYPGLPPADPVKGGAWDGFLSKVAKEKRRARKAIAEPDAGLTTTRVVPDIDVFCQSMLAAGIDLGSDGGWRSKRLLLGERSERQSAALVRTLRRHGVERIVLVDVEEDDDRVGAGGLVMLLPNAPQRTKLLAYLHRLARAIGYEGDRDSGQHWAYAKLDLGW